MVNIKIVKFVFLIFLIYFKNKLIVINYNYYMCMEFLIYLLLGLIIDVFICMDNIIFKIRL